MNPLSLPKWGKKQTLQLRHKWKSIDPGSLPSIEPKPKLKSRAEEALEKANLALSKITIQVSGIGSNNKSYTLAHEPGASLGYYLGLLDLKNLVTKAAVYDLANLEAGRIKLRYIPSPDAKIVFGPTLYSPVSHLQKGTSDPKAIIYGDVSLRYETRETAKVESKSLKDGVEQW